MPIYLYENPITKEVKEVVQRMTEEHVYSEKGIVWNRVFEVPQAAVDTLSNIDPFDRRAFIKKTGELKSVTQGDLWDLSKDLSDKRAKKRGKDPVKAQTEAKYKHRTGKAHPLA